MIEKIIQVKDFLTKSKLPESDFVINPYIGCPNGCKYCYACFMKRFSNHSENWGEFIDIKKPKNIINTEKIIGKTVFLSSVTDCYNDFEKKYNITRSILDQIKDVNFKLHISTKSKLILRDLNLLKQFKNLKVAISLNTLNEDFRKDMDKASSVNERLNTLKILNSNGIYTVLFLSPIFPEITEWKEILNVTQNYVNEYWFENLNLRGGYKKEILQYIEKEYPEYISIYKRIYLKNNKDYWENLSVSIEKECKIKKIKYINYFYHEKIKK